MAEMRDNVKPPMEAQWQAEMFANRLKKRLRHLSKWAKRAGTDAFRLYDRDIPEIPLVLDWYGGASPSESAVSGALYKRPYEKDESEELCWLAAMREAAAQATGLDKDRVIIKRRERQRQNAGMKTAGKAQYEKISDKGIIHEIREGGLTFKVNLSDYLDTGLFLDRRVMRRMVRADSSGKRVLNLFCHTAAFSVYAADGGAASTDSVDLSNTYLDWAQDNFALNDLSAQKLPLREYFCGDRGNSHTLIRADADTFLRHAIGTKAPASRRRWDMIILDPPAFSNSSMARADFDLRRDYETMLAQCLTLLAEGGKLWFSAAARSFKTTAAEIERSVAGVTVTDISEKTIDEDFRGKKTPKTFVIVKGAGSCVPYFPPALF